MVLSYTFVVIAPLAYCEGDPEEKKHATELTRCFSAVAELVINYCTSAQHTSRPPFDWQLQVAVTVTM